MLLACIEGSEAARECPAADCSPDPGRLRNAVVQPNCNLLKTKLKVTEGGGERWWIGFALFLLALHGDSLDLESGAKQQWP